MSSFNPESITSKTRIEAILKHLEAFPFAFVPCENKPQLSDSSRHLKVRYEIPKTLIYREYNRLSNPCSDSDSVKLEKYISAMNGASRDIPRHGGRLFSLSPKIDRSSTQDLDQYFDVLVKISNTVSDFTCFYHIGGGTIVRVLRGVTKMYISEVDDFEEHSKSGFFVQKYYPPTVDGRGSLKLNILSNTSQEGEKDEMPYHFDVSSHETATALMLGRFSPELQTVLVRAVLFGESVVQHIANSSIVGPSFHGTSLTNADKLAFLTLPSEPALIASLLQHFGSSIDDGARKPFDDYNFYRISPPCEAQIFAHYNWLLQASLHISSDVENLSWKQDSCKSSISYPNETALQSTAKKEGSRDISIPMFYDRNGLLTRARSSLFLRNRKVYKCNMKRTIFVLISLLILFLPSIYAAFGQGVDLTDAIEKIMSLLFFGTIVSVKTIAARRDEDLISDILLHREELKSSRDLDDVGFSDFLDLLQLEPDVHETLRPDRCEWVPGDKVGRTKLHRHISLDELRWMVLFLRENGDVFLGESNLIRTTPISRKAKLVGSGLIRVEGREERAYGYIMRSGKEPVYLE